MNTLIINMLNTTIAVLLCRGANRDSRQLAGARPIPVRGDDTVGNPHRAQICPFDVFKPILLSRLDK